MKKQTKKKKQKSEQWDYWEKIIENNDFKIYIKIERKVGS